MSSPTTLTMLSNSEDVGGVFRHAPVLNEVFELHRKSHHFSLKKKKPELFDTLARKIDHIPASIIREAYGLYLAAPASPKRPHPNYFIAIAMRLYGKEVDKKQKTSYIEKPIIFGKSI